MADFSEPKSVGRTRYVLCQDCGAALILEQGSDPRDKHSDWHEQSGQDRDDEFAQQTKQTQMQVFSEPSWSNWKG